MGKSQETFNKKEKEKKRLKKRKDKELKREERKASSKGGGLENMMAYVDEFGRISDTPPNPAHKKREIRADSIELGVPKREHDDVSPIHLGKVAFFDDSKGYGFIRDLQSQEKYFVHISGLTEEVRENDSVSFELEQGPKGLNAVRVKKTVAEPKRETVKKEEPAAETPKNPPTEQPPVA